MPTKQATGHWTDRAARAALALLGAALAFVTLAEHRSLRASREGAFAWSRRAGATLDVAAVLREGEPERVRLRAARAVLAAELDPARRRALPPAQAAPEDTARMAEVARQARELLARRPASWEAAYLLGAATYLGWGQTEDPRLFTRYRQWEAPLDAARRWAPARRDPPRFLAAAYLEIWPALSAHKREIARQLLAGIFRRPEDLRRFLEPWLDRAAGPREAFAVLPDDPDAWEEMAKSLGRRGDWAGHDAARRRADELLIARLRGDLLEAERRRSAGALEEARALYLAVAQRARPEIRFLPLLETALERCPPGPVDARTAERLEPHLEQALDRCLVAGCQIKPAALKRLSRFVREPEPAQAALAALFYDDLPGADVLERRTDRLNSEEWAPYLVTKARVLAERGRGEEARAVLAGVHPAWQSRPLYWQAAAEIAEAAGDAAAQAEAAARLAAMARRAWAATDWTWRRGVARLEMVTDVAVTGLTVRLDAVPEGGTAVELWLDGTGLGSFPVRPAAGQAPALRLAVPLRPGVHVVEIANAQRSQIAPGAVELR